MLSTDLYQAVVETIADGIITIDSEGWIIAANSSAERMFGYAKDELVGGNISILIPSPHDVDHDSYVERYIATGVKRIIGLVRELEGKRKNGEVFPIELSVSEIPTGQGPIFTGIVRDITDRKASETRLRESEERFRFLNELTSATRSLSDPEEVMATTARMLGAHLGASRCAYANVAEDGNQFDILHDYTHECPSAVGHFRVSDFGEFPGKELRAGRTLVISDVLEQVQDEAGQRTFASMSVRASVCCPLAKDGVLRAFIAVHQTEPRQWRASEITLIEDVVERCWAWLEQIKARQALERQQVELRALFDLMPALIWFKDTANNVLRANRQAAKIAGLELDQIEGRPAGDVYPLDSDQFFQDDLDVIRSGEPKLGIIERLRGPGGGETWIQTDKVPLKAGDGRVMGILVVSQDITERRRADEQVRLLSSAIEQSTESVMITDAQLDPPGPHVIFVNPAFTQMTGYSADEIIGKTPRILHGPETERAVLDRLRSCLESGEIFIGEATNYRKNGESYTQSWQIVPLRDGDQKVTHFVAVLRDVTEQRRNELALQQAFSEVESQVAIRTADLAKANEDLLIAVAHADASNKAKSEFLSRMSHELRTPMNSVLGYAQLLTLQYQDPRIQESAKCILRSGSHLLHMINEVLDLSRIESGGLSVSNEPVDLIGTVSQAINVVEPLAKSKQIELTIRDEVQAGLHIHADRQRLLQVLINLLGNAVKFNKEAGTVEVTCREKKGVAEICVADTGRGISLEDQEHLFEPFQRFGDPGVEGTGLGLVLSQRFTQLMGGRLWLESSSANGSVFCLELPVAEAPPPVAREKSEGYGFSVLEGYAGKVLYIEDNPANMRLLESVLEDVPGIRLLPAVQGSMGVTLAQQHLPDLILLDVHLPDMNGDKVLRLLKENPSTSSIPVVMLSADATPRQIDNLLSQGAADYITKPFELIRLFEVMRTYLPRGTAQP